LRGVIDVCYAPTATKFRIASKMTLCAISGLMHRSNAAFSKGAGRWDNSSMLSKPWHFAFVQ
jgi:hypothetical protein